MHHCLATYELVRHWPITNTVWQSIDTSSLRN